MSGVGYEVGEGWISLPCIVSLCLVHEYPLLRL
jgi:hypothetical protein